LLIFGPQTDILTDTATTPRLTVHVSMG